MNKKTIGEALCALSNGRIVMRRKFPVISVVLLLAALGVLVGEWFLRDTLSADLSSSVVLVASSVLIYALLAISLTLFYGKGTPYDTREKGFLSYEEIYFERGKRAAVTECVEHCLPGALADVERSRIPELAVVVLRSKDSRLAAMQMFEYTELEYKALTELKVCGL